MTSDTENLMLFEWGKLLLRQGITMMARRNLSHPSTAVPSDVRPKYEAITALTDAFCKRYLNEEYAEMCRRLTVALARRRPMPLARGRKEVWACGIVRTIGWANMLDDPKQSPYMKLIDIDPEFGVAESTGQAKSLAIRRMFGIGRLKPDWTLPSRLGDNSLIWKVEVNGMLVDIRQEFRERQEAAFQKQRAGRRVAAVRDVLSPLIAGKMWERPRAI